MSPDRPFYDPRQLWSLWCGVRRPVKPGEYFFSGLFLASLKYAVDVLIVYRFEGGRIWLPGEYLHPFGWTTRGTFEAGPTQLLMLIWMLPFLWIGASMTARRARDAGISAVWALLFFVPFVNYLVMISLSVAGTMPKGRADLDRERAERATFGARAIAVSAGLVVLLPIAGVMLSRSFSYGFPLFVGAPFVQGFVTSFIYSRRVETSALGAARLAGLGLLTMAALLLVGGIEGIACIIMALPLGLLASAGAAFLAHALASVGRTPRQHLYSFALLLPLATLPGPLEVPLREVETVLEIDAPPEVVWKHVTQFSELPPIHELYFKMGIAYPIRAHYEGEGENAVRYCEFSTGPFVEPITHWEEPHRLAFDVIEQPPTMEEWSPYKDLAPPHVENGLTSERGEFRLVALPDGRTRLEGSTWYRLHMAPQAYWTLWSDGLIHAIHKRVLRHIRAEAEAAAHGRVAS